MPRPLSPATSRATSSRTLRAIATPSIRSAGKVYRPRPPDDDDLDLTRILELRFHAPRDLLGERGAASIIDVVRHDDHANLAAGLNGEHLVNAAIAGRNALEPLEPLDVGLERFAPSARTRAGDCVGGL